MYVKNYGCCAVKKDRRISLPTIEPFPSSYTETQVARVDGANNTIYTVPLDGYYRVQVSGGGGGTAYNNANTSHAGGTNKIVYLYKGTKCLLWSGGGGGAGSVSGSDRGYTGYPSPGTSSLGGTGASGYNTDESGGGGGGAASHGEYCVYESGHGGAGSGFLAGLPANVDVPNVTHKETAWDYSISSQRDWSVGSFSVGNLYCYILCGGSGGNCSDNGGHRAGGGGGGAFGSGGDTHYQLSGVAGPGKTWGKGNDGARYSAGADGAWCIMDFSRNQWTWGTGSGASSGQNGYCILKRIIPS